MGDVVVETLLRLLSGWHLFYLLVGVYVGLVMGVLPALGGSAGMAVLLPSWALLADSGPMTPRTSPLPN